MSNSMVITNIGANKLLLSVEKGVLLTSERSTIEYKELA